MRVRGFAFREEARHERYGKVAVAEDLYENPWDLIEPAPQGQRTLGGMEERIDSMLPPVLRPKIVPRS